MLSLLKLFLSLGCGAALGLALTYYSIADGPFFGARHLGAWTVWPDMGSAEPNPYERAVMARAGIVPLGVAEGITLTATADDSGRPLSGACTYRLMGQSPAARAWTLTLTTPARGLVDNPARRYGFTDQEIVRDSEGRFEIVVGPSARSGNWLPTGQAPQFVLVLRLYDTALTAVGAALAKANLPGIAKGTCP